jgi:hypothetical protein
VAHRGDGKREFAATSFLIGWVAQDTVWPLFDGWCAEHGVDPGALPFDRALNLIYHFAVRNATKEKKQEFDSTMSNAVSRFKLEEMAATRRNALRATESANEPQGVPEVPANTRPNRNAKLPPRPAGWGDDLTATQQSLAVAQSLKVGKRAP